MRLADLTHAEIARTVASGRHLGLAQVAWSPTPFRVRHAADAEGNPIMLCRTGGELARALQPRDGGDTAVVLSVDSPAGRVWISGWSHPIHGAAAHAAALEFCDVNPASDLLDVGRGFELHHLDVAEVRLESGTETIEIDVAAYASASPADEGDGSGPVM